MTQELHEALINAEDERQAINRGDYAEEAAEVLKFMQRRDYRHLDRQISMAKDDIIKDTDFGRWALSIPEDHFAVLKLMYPNLANPDAEEKTKAWKSFMMTGEALPYKINQKLRSM